jgi:hypothetical protein
MATKSVQFTVDVKGESSGKQFKGVFQAKERLTMRDRLDRDILRRNLLNNAPDEAVGPAAKSVALVLSEINIRLTKFPDWWTTSDNGLELEDENVVMEVYTACKKIEDDAKEALIKDADKQVDKLLKPKDEV